MSIARSKPERRSTHHVLYARVQLMRNPRIPAEIRIENRPIAAMQAAAGYHSPKEDEGIWANLKRAGTFYGQKDRNHNPWGKCAQEIVQVPNWCCFYCFDLLPPTSRVKNGDNREAGQDCCLGRLPCEKCEESNAETALLMIQERYPELRMLPGVALLLV